MIVVERRIDHGPGTVFEALADGWAYANWVVGASRIRDVDDEWPLPGSRIHHSVGAWPLLIDDTTSVLEVEPPHRLVLQARAWPFGEARVAVELTDLGDGSCRVTMAEDAARGVGRFVPRPLRVLALAPRNRESLRRLHLLCRRYAAHR